MVPTVARGLTDVSRDDLGIVRIIPPTGMDDKGVKLRSFSRQMLFRIGGDIPEESFRLRYPMLQPNATIPIPRYPAEYVNLLPRYFFEDRVVLIGMDSQSEDRFRTPYRIINPGGTDTIPGVMIHALAINQVLLERYEFRFGHIQLR